MSTITHEPTGRLLAKCDDIREAEDLIAVFEQVDPEGVHAGDYGIDATEEEDFDFQNAIPVRPGENLVAKVREARAAKPEPTAEQLAAVRAYAARKGPHWKHKLMDAWLDGSDAYQPDGHLLRQVRNQLGSRWLAKFKLPRS
jgi:hypothetical protein